MHSYWWQCMNKNCNKTFNFDDVTNSKGIVHFILDELLPNNWNPKKLILRCKKCNKKSLRIMYEFPRKDKTTLIVVNIVGIESSEKRYLRMMWETMPLGEPKTRWFDFKYVNGRNIWGLMSSPIFTQQELKKILSIYKKITKQNKFP